MELKEYQQRASDRLDRWLEVLLEERGKWESRVEALASIGQLDKDLIADFPKLAWKNLADRHELPDSVLQLGSQYTHRTTGSGHPLPHVCLKIPTGGGKTLMGAVAIERFLVRTGQQAGLVLWIVPTKAIYAQTKAALWNREHPYRQRLERACGGRVKVMEKDDALSKRDIGNYLCVMLLMFQSTNRINDPDYLRINRDSGRYPGFFPEDGDAFAEGEFANAYPSLMRDRVSNRVRHSLSNVFKVARPIVILDEAHKAYGGSKMRETNARRYAETISEMDPSIVIELTATPNANISNLLVDVTGVELQDEQMIKLPIQVTTQGGNASWQHTLTVARERIETLVASADAFEVDTGRYIRPIAVVRAERTGKNERDGKKVHVEDVRDELINQGVDPSAIRVKSAEVDELGRESLIDPLRRSRVQWILTKDALKEGWDCPFAYVLVVLDTLHSERAVTQMVGRVMRMPDVEFTGVKDLDQCYVICHNADVRRAVEHVRDGLQCEGMGDLDRHVRGDATDSNKETESIRRRKRFRGVPIYLPKVLCKAQDGSVRDLDYDRDILSTIDWDRLAIENPQAILAPAPAAGSAAVDASGEARDVEDYYEPVNDDNWISYFTHHLSSLIPNPWACSVIVRDAIKRIECGGSTTRSDILARRSVYAEEFRRDLFEQIDRRAKAKFRELLDAGVISFNLEASEANYQIREEIEYAVRDDDHPLSKSGNVVQSSLFEMVLKRDFNNFERDFAFYIEGNKAISWWHRVAVSQRSGYYLRGWRRERVFPDFVALATRSGDLQDYRQQLLIFETKGAHLKDNDDSRYKRCLMSLLEAVVNGDLAPSGLMRIREGEPKGAFRMVIQGQEHKALEGTLAADPS